MMTCWKNIINIICQRLYSKEFDSKPVYYNKFLEIKVECQGDEVTNFYDKEIPKVGSNHDCLAVISLDSTLKKDENYQP